MSTYNKTSTCDVLNCSLRSLADPVRHLVDAHKVRTFSFEEISMIRATDITSGCFFELLATAIPLRFASPRAAQSFVFNTIADTYSKQQSGSNPSARDNFTKRFFDTTGLGGMQFEDLDVIAKVLDCTFVICATKIPKQNSPGKTNTKYFSIGQSTTNSKIFMKWEYNLHYQLVKPTDDTDDEEVKVPLIRNQTHPEVLINGKPEYDEFKDTIRKTPSAFVKSKVTLQSLSPPTTPPPVIPEQEEEINAAINLVREHLIKDFFPGLETHIKIIVATSIASSIVSVSANISALIGGKLGKANKAIQVTSIVTSLMNFTASVSFAFRSKDIKFNFDKVVAAIPALASTLHSTYQANSASWIYPTISALVSLIIGGLTLFNIKDVKEVIQAGSLLKTLNTFGSEAKNITKYILEDLLELDITGDHIQHTTLIKMAKRSAELCVLPHYKFFGDPGLLQELKSLSKEALDLTAKKFNSTKTSQVARLTAQTLMVNVTQLQEKELAIRTVFDSHQRQETFGVMFAGKPSVGKSYLLTHIWSKLAPLFDYKKDLYNLTISRSDGYFEPYGMQDCGFVNEFMGARQDPFLSHLNSTISADPMNLEGAFQKSQPAQFKLVFLTSNDISPELTRDLTLPATQAVWNRILRIQIEDPLCQGRQGINTHRKPDFSHLQLSKVTFTEATSKEDAQKSLQPISLDSLIVEIAHQMARREKSYLNSIINNDLFNNEQEAMRLRIARLDKILSTTNWSNSDAPQGGNSYNIIRLQGPLETGKTALAHEIASAVTSVYYKRELVVITQQSQFLEKPSKQPKVYLLDDIIDESTHNDYFKWINSCNADSLFIITSNTSYQRSLTKSEWIKTKALNCFGFSGADEHFYVDTRHTHSGIARRLGLYGRVDAITNDGTETTVNNPDMQMTIDATPGFQYKINGTPISPEDIKQHVYRTYTAFIAKSHKIQVLNSTFCNPEQDYDVKITADNIDSLYDAFSSTTNVTKLLFFGAVGADVSISKRVMITIPREMQDATTLIPNKKLETRDDVISLAKRLGAFLVKIIPDIKIYFHLKGQSPIVLMDKRLYIGADNVLTIDITRSSDAFHWVFQGKAHQLKDEDFASFTATGILPPSMQELPQFITAAIVSKYTAMRHEETPLIRTWINHYKVDKMIADYKQNGLLSFIIDHKALTLCAGILGISTLAILGTKLYQLLSPTNESNSADDEDDPDSSHYKEISHLKSGYRNALVKGDRLAMVNIHNQARQEGLYEKLNQWEHAFRSNSYLTRPKSEIELMIRESINNQDLDSLSFFIKFDPDTVKELLANKSNMLSSRETQHQMPTVPQLWIEKLRRNYVLVINPITRAKVFALGLKDKTAMTVSHIFHQVGEECIIQSDGIQYAATCVSLHRQRDMAIIQITDKRFPSFKNLTSALVSVQEFSKFSTAWFVRPTDKPLIYSASTKFKGRSVFTMMDSNNPLYALSHDFWEFHLIGMKDLTSTFSSGDCGLPLMAMFENEWKIIGIHNSINGISSTGFFSSISIEDLSNVANSTSNKVPHLYDPDTGYVLDSSTYKALTETEWQDSKYNGVSPLKIIGRNAALHTHSSPKHKKKYISVCDEILECETLPSALDMTHVVDTSKLVPDKTGSIYPLFTQAVKYTKKTSTYGQFNKEIFDHVQESIKQYYTMHYGEPKQLKLREVINGFENVQPFDMTTSAGPKMKRDFGINIKIPKNHQSETLFINCNKDDLQKKPFYVINTKTSAGNTLMQDYHHYMSAIEAGDPILLVIKDNAKVELLPKEKVQEGKVRLFNEMDLSVNMVLKSYFGGFLNSVIEKHHECIYTIGFNPYKEATLHMLDFNMIDGYVVSSDYSGLDKSLPQELITGFVQAVSRGKWTPDTEMALAKTLTNTYHSLNGHIYPVNCGNESGSYVTTILNCYSVHFANWYTFTRKWLETYGIMPSLKDFEDNFCQKILGDDCIRKISHRLKITFEDLAQDAALFNLTLTQPKIEGEISFCSRVYRLIRPNLYAPCLKTSSITSCLFYLASETNEQIAMNINVALFEASLHGKEYFETIAKGAMALAKHYNITIDIYPHKCYIDYFIGYVLNESKHPTLQAAGSLLTQSIESNSCENILKEKQFNKMADMWLNEYVQKHRLESPSFSFVMDGKTEWDATVYLKDLSATSHGRTKQQAKRAACEQLKTALLQDDGESEQFAAINEAMADKDMDKLVQLLEKQFNLKMQPKNTNPFREVTPSEDGYQSNCRIDYEDEYLSDAKYYKEKAQMRKLKVLRNKIRGNGPDVLSVEEVPLTKEEIQKYDEQRRAEARGRLFSTRVIRRYSKSDDLCVCKGKSTSTLSNTSVHDEGKLIQQLLVEVDHPPPKIHPDDVKVKMHFGSKKESDLLPQYKEFPTEEDKKKLAEMDRGRILRREIKDSHFILSNFKPKSGSNFFSKHLIDSTPMKVGFKANADTPIEPASMNQASRFQGEGSLPANANPQPTAVVPAMTSSGEDIQAAIMGQEQHTLNPIGAPDMSTVGAIQFDLKDLAYQQYMDCDTQIEVNADMPAGTVIAQIPYGWNHPYLNLYAKQWILQHERYTGSFKYRWTVIGNPLFSGALGIAWYPRRVASSIIPVSQMQKYSYSAKGVTMPFNVIHTLHDARKGDFYREVSDDENDADMAQRPHLVLFLLMSLQNPLQPGVITRIRVASKLATVGEGNPFRALNPRDQQVVPTTANTPVPQNSFRATFPQDLNKRLWLYTDGNLAASTRPTRNAYYPDMDYTARKNGIVGGQQGGTGPNDQSTYYNVENWARTDQVDKLSADWPWIIGKSVDPSDDVTVFISTVTNMDQKSFYQWIDNVNWPGFQKNGTNDAMTWNKWNSNKGYLPDPLLNGGIVTHSSTYNQLELPYATNIGAGGSGFKSTIKEWIKYVTDKGTIFFLLCYTEQLRGVITPAFPKQVAVRFAGHYQTSKTLALPFGLPQYPIFNVDEQLGAVSSNINTLPTGNLLFRITEMPPSSVAVGQAQMPTCNDNATVAKHFARLAENLSTLQCLQFNLIDAQSVRSIATVRYLQESGVFVINALNAPTRYRVLPQNNENIIFGQVAIVQRATDFQETPVFEWVDRVAPTFLRRGDYFETPIRPDYFSEVTPTKEGFKANAALLASVAGGGLQGIGNAIGQHQDRKHQEKMQGNQFNHESMMQGNMFDFQNQFQSNNFDFQKMMQENQFGFQNNYQGQQHAQEQLLQERGYQNDLGMLQSSHQEQRETNKQQSQNRMMERGLSSRVMGMPGATMSGSQA